MLSRVLDRVGHRRLLGNRSVLVSVPAGATSAERLVLHQTLRSAGASRIYLIEQVLAAAIGADMAITLPLGSMIVLIGAGCTEAAIMSLGGIVYTTFARVGGESMNQSILFYLRHVRALLTDLAAAERIKTEIGSATAPADGVGRKMSIKGRDVVTGLVKEIEVTEAEIRDALSQDLDVIRECIAIALDEISPELSADLVNEGIVLAGGGALLAGLKEWIHDKTGLPVTLADDAIHCVVDGAGQALENPDLRGLVFEYRRS
jgi:rod shape-determining protein MreB